MGSSPLRFIALFLSLSLISCTQVASSETIDQLIKNGNVALETRNNTQAESIWRKVIQLDPRNAIAHSNLCDALYRQNRLSEARGFCRTAIELDPQLPDAHKNFGNVLLMQGKTDEAKSAYLQSIQLNPNYAPGYGGIGIIFGIDLASIKWTFRKS